MKDVSTTVLQRKAKMSNVLEFKEFKVVYRRYASLFFIIGNLQYFAFYQPNQHALVRN